MNNSVAFRLTKAFHLLNFAAHQSDIPQCSLSYLKTVSWTVNNLFLFTITNLVHVQQEPSIAEEDSF